MSFLKVSRGFKSFLFPVIILAEILFFNSCKQLVDMPSIPNASSGAAKAVEAPGGLEASNGLRRKITLEWTFVGNAKLYYIYYASNPNDEFIKIGQTESNTFDDIVAPGKTAYYKIRAAKYDGTLSDFSNTVKGTSLATPVISNGDVEEGKVTLYWYMENARDIKTDADNYESILQFTVVCENLANPADIREIVVPGNVNEYAFENLASNVEYQYYVSAYITGYQSDEEISTKVTEKTIKSACPQMPEVTASEGEYSNGIELTIKLPPKVQITAKVGEKDEEFDCPICFKIERKIANANTDYEVVCDRLYFNYDKKENPTNTPPADEGGYSNYNPGSLVYWTDKDSGLARGVVYEYNVTSYVDVNYSHVIKDSDYISETSSKDSKKVTGWVSKRPEFKVKNIERNISDGNVKSVSFDLDASWDDKGKAPNYKFAVKQSKSENVDFTDTVEESWLANGSGNLFNTIAEVNKTIEVAADEKAYYYKYTLYIVPNTCETAEDGLEEEKRLDFAEADTVVPVSTEATVPEPKITEIKSINGGFEITFEKEENVTYSLERKVVDKNGVAIGTPVKFAVTESPYHDTNDIKSNTSYAYILHATASSGTTVTSAPYYVQTLGNPVPKFDKNKLAYDSIEITFNNITAAKKYTIKLGAEGGFGGGNEVTFDALESAGSSSVSMGEATVTITLDDAEKYTIVIQNPKGYNDATSAGNKVACIVTAIDENGSTAAGSVDVKVLGPAGIGLQGTADTSSIDREKITIKWKKIEDAKGYAVYRTRVAYGDCEGEKAAKTDVYYVSTDGKVTLKTTGELSNSGVTVTPGDTFTLVDTQTPATGNFVWNKNQALIAWGLEYKYTVYPVLDEKDIDSDSFKIAYTNNDSVTKSGYTYGYGIGLTASKADDPKKVKLTWDAPHTNPGTAKVFRRLSSDHSGKWEFANVTTGETSILVTPDNLYTPYDYIVKYESSVANFDLHDSYETEIYKTSNADSSKEDDCKGYVFTLEKNLTSLFSAKHESGYKESVSWSDSLYNKELKKVLPTKVEIQILNKNLTKGWTTVLTLNPSTFKKNGEGNGTDVKYDTTSSEDYKAVLYPTGMTSASSPATNGLLKVLRDYKHYYRIKATRTNAAGTEIVSTMGDDESVSAYRDITDEELAKITMLTIASAMDGTDIYSKSETGLASQRKRKTLKTGENGGTFDWMKIHKIGGTGDFILFFKDYVHIWDALPGSEKSCASFLKLSDENSSEEIRGRHDGDANKKLITLSKGSKSFGSLIEMTVSHVDSNLNLSSYSGIVKFSCSDDELKINIKRGSNDIEIVNITKSTENDKDTRKENLKYWSPIRIGDVDTFFGKNSTYGWWPKD